MSALNCSRLQCSAICKNAACGVVAVHNARAITAGPPAGLIDMHRALIQHPVLQLADAGPPAPPSALADRVHRAGRERDAEQIARELADPAAGDPMPGGQRHHRRLQPRPERRSADLSRQPGAGPRATVPAAQLMGAMLGQDHADRRQLGDLVATEPPARPALPIIEPASASATRIRVVIDDLIHLILGLQLATRTPMPGLPTRPAPLTLPAHQLLRLRTRLRPPLRPRLRRIHRRRPRARARILTRLLLQPPQPILMLLNPAARSRMNSTHASRPAS